jgi:NADH-quinone oxidoreductase subunit L
MAAHAAFPWFTVPPEWFVLIPLLPLGAFAVLILTGRRLGASGAWLSVAALAASAWLTLGILEPVLHGVPLAARWVWLLPASRPWSVGLMVDGLSWLMLLVVTVVGTLILLYSIGYMRGDPRYSRFFAYMSLFCASMLGLVLADHFVLLYACWELVGVCSYLLISFWFERPAAAAAGRKAFITTRIGDTGLLVGILLLAAVAGQLDFARLEATRELFLLRGQGPLLTLITALIFFGAIGKSAQVPLHVWLPDAMEGPTSVSALIHAATMVAAGVYLVARTLPLFTPESVALVLAIGLFTHLVAGTIALTMTDIKRVLAYSTMSQLGLMMTALGLGAMAAAMFHLATHAVFKALLFLAAGSVIHATHRQDLSQLGGLSRAMPWTRGVFLIGALSMGGAPLLAGFWSKDAILLAAHQRPWLQETLLAGAVLTAAYISRLYLRCFHGPQPTPAGTVHDRPHESPPVMVVPMALLAFGALTAGLAGSPWLHGPIFQLLGEETEHALDEPLALWSTAALAVGATLAWVVGVRHRLRLPQPMRPLGHRLYLAAAHRYYVDECYERLVIGPWRRLSEWLAAFDERVIDGAVNGAGRGGWGLSRLKAWVDAQVVDRAVDGLAHAVRASGGTLRLLQTGVAQQYLLAVAAAVVVLAWMIQ